MSNARNLANLLGTNTTIQTANLADDAITSAKLATDAVVADGLSSSAIQHGDLPSGSILQVVSVNDDRLQTNSNTAPIAIFGANASITMKGNNKLLVMATITGCSTSSVVPRILFQIFRNGSAYLSIGRDVFYSVGDVRASFAANAVFNSGHTAGQTYDFNIHFGQIGGGTMTVGSPFNGGGNHNLTVMEIAS